MRTHTVLKRKNTNLCMRYTKGELEKFWIDSGFLLETLVGVHHLSHFKLPIILSPEVKCLSNYPRSHCP